MYSEATHFNSKYSLSVVIPSLGGSCLYKTIESLNSGNFKPDEILISLPSKEHVDKIKIKENNVKLLNTNCYGQVSQRLEGFKQAKYNFVMQMDDDIELSINTLERMIQLLIELGPGNAIGPSFFDPISKETLHKFDLGLVGFLKSLNAFIFSGSSWGLSRMGKITKIGVSYGVDANFFKENVCEVEWLPGGCVLNYKQDLILEDYFPYSGKAFSEDIIHSIMRSSKNIKHYVAFQTMAITDLDEKNFNWKDFKSEFHSRLYIIKLLGGNKIRLGIWGISQFLIRQITWKK